MKRNRQETEFQGSVGQQQNFQHSISSPSQKEKKKKKKDINRLKIKGCQKNTPGNINLKQIQVTISTSDRLDFRTNKITRDKEGHYMTMKVQSSRKT